MQWHTELHTHKVTTRVSLAGIKRTYARTLGNARERGCSGIFICCEEMNRTGSADIKINETDGTRAF